MIELNFKVETIKPLLKLGKETITTYLMSNEIDGGKIKIEFKFGDPMPARWLRLLGKSTGNEIIVSIGLKSRQTTF